MRKLSILMAALFCAGASSILSADDLNPQPLPPGAHSGGGGNTERKAGENNLTLHDQNQISGNLNGDGKTGNSLDKHDGFQKTDGESKFKSHSSGGGAGKTKITGSSVKGPTSGNGGLRKHHNGNGDSKVQSYWGGGGGKAKITGNGLKKSNTFQKQNSFFKANGTTKPGMADGSALPAVQSAH